MASKKASDFWDTFNAYMERTEQNPMPEKGPVKKTINDKRAHLAKQLRDKASSFESGAENMGYTEGGRQIPHDFHVIAGVIYFVARHGVTILRTDEGKEMKLCFGSDRKAAVSTVRELADRVEAGDLDSAINRASEGRGRAKGTKNKPKDTPAPTPQVSNEPATNDDTSNDEFTEEVPVHTTGDTATL